jgi:hypothetical protein
LYRLNYSAEHTILFLYPPFRVKFISARVLSQ